MYDDRVYKYGHARIKTFEIKADLFDALIADYRWSVKIVDTVEPYMCGYDGPEKVVYDGREWAIAPIYIVHHYAASVAPDHHWKQCRIRRVENMEREALKTTNGGYAWNYMIKLLAKFYVGGEEDVYEQLRKHEAEYDPGLKQYHYAYPVPTYKIKRLENCYYYDINGAHCDALTEIFPEADLSLKLLYAKRKKDPVVKAYINYFVGMLCKKGFRKTYNWIVQRTTRKLYAIMDECGGVPVYANTDGLIVRMPENILAPSKKLGDVKMEYAGDVYVYQDKNYWIIQYGDTIKGSAMSCVRDKIDLREGRVVQYDKVRKVIAHDEDLKEVAIYAAENVREVHI